MERNTGKPPGQQHHANQTNNSIGSKPFRAGAGDDCKADAVGAEKESIQHRHHPLPWTCRRSIFQETHPGSGTLNTSKQVQKEHSSFQNCTHAKNLYPQKSLRGALSPLRKSIQQTAVTRTRSLLSKAHSGKETLIRAARQGPRPYLQDQCNTMVCGRQAYQNLFQDYTIHAIFINLTL